MTPTSSLGFRNLIALLLVLASAGPLLAGDAPSAGEFFLLEIPPSEARLPAKTILRIHAGNISLIAPETLVDDKGNKYSETACVILKIDSDLEGLITCTVGEAGKLVLDRKAKTVLMPMFDSAKPLVAQTSVQAAEQVGISWITSKKAFVGNVRKGDVITNYLLGPSVGISDHYAITLWDGTRLDVYAPDNKIRSAYVESEGDGEIEWLIKGNE